MANGTHLVSSIPLSLFDYLCGSGVTMTTAQWKTKISFHKKTNSLDIWIVCCIVLFQMPDKIEAKLLQPP